MMSETKRGRMCTRCSAVHIGLAALGLALALSSQLALAQVDPGPRGGAAGAGGPLPGLTPRQLDFFNVGKEDFEEIEGLADGLGPRMNLDGCGACHVHPATGGTSPAINPQVAFANKDGGTDVFPTAVIFNGYIPPHGPIREVRFKRNADGTPDGSVHNTATISGREGAFNTCGLQLENFAAQFAAGNVIFRIPTPLFGAGLIETIHDAVLLSNLGANAAAKRLLGISGRPNRNANDGRISRFGWKAQNQTLLQFSGEAYNVEMGISNELFQIERDETVECQFAQEPNDITETEATETPEALNAIEKFAFFQRFLDQPTPSLATPGGSASIARGRSLFGAIGCAHCHTPALDTGDHPVAALNFKRANLYSDLMLHGMGPGLADGISQGLAGGDEFRTAPLWGLGQRLFFLHDGRTSNLLRAIRAHASNANSQFPASEANAVIQGFDSLSVSDQQDILNFLRSL